MTSSPICPSSEVRGSPAKASILLVEDEELLAEALVCQLEDEGFACDVSPSLKKARQALAVEPYDLVLLDVRLPDGNGLDFLAELKAGSGVDLPIVILTSFAKVEDAVRALKLGAADYLVKPDDPNQTLFVLERALSDSERRRKIGYARERDILAVEGVELLGNSVPMQNLRREVSRIASLDPGSGGVAPTVLILGETGAGKDFTARSIHRAGPLAGRPFVQVDCAALPGNLIEAELFGHEKGAFTQADHARTGLIEAAEDGTLFLDEIGELPLDLQAKLLAVLDRRTVRRIGSSRERAVRARFIAATNRDLSAMVDSGRFRADLFYRLNVLSLSIPPLRERKSDIMPLARKFADEVARRFGLEPIRFDEGSERALVDYSWPGNVRELKHVMERAGLLHPGGLFPVSFLDVGVGTGPSRARESSAERGVSEEEVDYDLERMEKHLIRRALQREGGNVSRAARLLGLSRGSLRSRMARHGLDRSD